MMAIMNKAGLHFQENKVFRNTDFANLHGFQDTCLADALSMTEALQDYHMEVLGNGPTDLCDALEVLDEANMALRLSCASELGSHLLHTADHFTVLEVAPNRVEWKNRHWSFPLRQDQLTALLSVKVVVSHVICPKPDPSAPMLYTVVNVSGGASGLDSWLFAL